MRKLLKKLSKDSLVAHDPKRHIVIAAIRCVDAVSSTALHGDLMAMMGHYSKRDPVPDPQPPGYEDPNDPYDFPPPPERATRRILRRTADGDEVLDRSPDSHASVSDGVQSARRRRSSTCRSGRRAKTGRMSGSHVRRAAST